MAVPNLMSEVVRLSTAQRIGVAVGSAVGAFVDPYRDDLVASLLEVVGTDGLKALQRRVLSIPEGRQVLEDQPFISSKTIDLETLRTFPENTFGRKYVNWLDSNRVTPDTRKPVRFIEDPDLAYLVLRIRQTHDFFHVLLNMPTVVSGELAVKIVEAGQLRLPMPFLAGVFGPLSIIRKTKEMDKFCNKFLPVALKNIAPNHNSRIMLTAYFEKRFEQDISDFQKEFNIIPYVEN